MKKSSIAVFLFVVSLIASSCNKDELSCIQPVVVSEDAEYPYHMSYWIDENHFSETLRNGTELTLFFQKLNDLAFQGHHIRVCNEDVKPSANPTKDVVLFDTKDIAEFDKWKDKMMSDGYEVEYYYDRETGIIHGVATRKE